MISLVLTWVKLKFNIFLRKAQTHNTQLFHSLTMTFTTSRDPSGTTTIAPRNEADQTATIVLCHGLGDSAQGWEDVAEVCTIIIIVVLLSSDDH